MKYGKNNGITLIALIITIIIMIILAAVAISIAINGGLFDQAQNASELTKESIAREKLDMLLGEYQTQKYGDNPLSILDFFLDKKEKGEVQNVADVGDELIITIDGYEYLVDKETGNIGKLTQVEPPAVRRDNTRRK